MLTVQHRFCLLMKLAVHQLFVVLDCSTYNLLRLGSVEKLLYRGLLVLELLVDHKEVHNFVKDVGRKLVYRLNASVGGVGEGDSDNLVILLATVDHSHSADGVHLNEGHGNDRLGAKNENVQRVTVICIGARNEAVVCGIVGGGVEYAIETEHTGLFVKLVLTVATLGYFNYGRKIGRCNTFFGKIVPNVHMCPP